MTTREYFEGLQAEIRLCAEIGHESAWEKAQDWKHRAKAAMRSIFGEYIGCKPLEEKVGQLFNPSLIASTGMRPIQSTPEDEITHKFKSDAKAAVAIMDDCKETLRRLHEKFDPDREYLPDNTHEQMTVILGTNPPLVVKAVAGTPIACKSVLTHAASKALDIAMDAEDDRFEGAKDW